MMDRTVRRKSFTGQLSDNILYNIYRISGLLAQTSPIDKALTTIVETVNQGLGFTRTVLYLINKNDETLLECKVITGFTPELEQLARSKPYKLGKHDCIETKVAITGNLILVKDFFSDPNVTSLDLRVTRKHERGCALYVPLKIKGSIIGIVGVDRKKNEPEITEQEVESLTIFAGFASTVIENARLYEALLSEKFFSESILDSSLHGIVTVDLHGIITSTNTSAEKLFEVKKSSALSKHMREVLPFLPELVAVFESVLTNKENIENFEYNYDRESHKKKMLSISSSFIFDEKNNLKGVLFTIQDVTSLRERDNYFQRVNRLISLGEMASGVAHEVRNPLTGIGVVLDILKRRGRYEKDDKILIDEAILEIERLEKIVTDLLEFARPRDFNFVATNINEIVKSIHFLLVKQCKNQNIKLSFEFADNIKKSRMDRERMKQALLNVAINAIQAMLNGGNLVIETSCSGINDGEEENIVVKVKDTGLGIHERDRESIFDPFFTTRSNGTGLGLSITYSIIKEHQGSVKVNSMVGKGTEFIISLPIMP